MRMRGSSVPFPCARIHGTADASRRIRAHPCGTATSIFNTGLLCSSFSSSIAPNGAKDVPSLVGLKNKVRPKYPGSHGGTSLKLPATGSAGMELGFNGKQPHKMELKKPSNPQPSFWERHKWMEREALHGTWRGRCGWGWKLPFQAGRGGMTTGRKMEIQDSKAAAWLFPCSVSSWCLLLLLISKSLSIAVPGLEIGIRERGMG